MTFLEKIQANQNGYSEQLASYGVNSNIKDFADFKQELIRQLSSTPQGQGAVNYLTEEELVLLFQQRNVREQMENNVGKERADEMYRFADRTDLVVTRKVPVGTKTGQRDLVTFRVGKPIKSKGYVRKGKQIKSYSRGYNKWTIAQNNFLLQKRVLLRQKKTTISKIAFEYNKEFSQNKRSSSSISSRLYRI